MILIRQNLTKKIKQEKKKSNMTNNRGNSKEQKFEKILKAKLYPLIFLSIIVFISVSLLIFISNITKEKIAAERDAQIVEQLKLLFPEMQDFKYDKNDYYKIYSSNQIIGYAFTTKGKGYGGDINILVGIDSSFMVKGINIISNTETPGLGTKITESFFIDQFKGLSLEEINLSKNGGKVDAITGATISSKAVVDAVRNELKIKIDTIKKQNN